MFSEKKNITTQLYEGVLFPIPLVMPDPSNTSKKEDSGEVWFDFNRIDLDDYAEFGGKINVRSSLGVSEDVLYQSAKEHVSEIYEGVTDIQLGDYRYITSTEFKRIVIPYKVTL